MNYYRNPDPVKAIPAYLEIVQLDFEWLKKRANVIKFFDFLFKENEFLLDYMSKQYLIMYQTQPFLEAFQATVAYGPRHKLALAKYFPNQIVG